MEYIKTYELFGGLKKFFTRKPKPLPKVYNTSDDIINDNSLSHEEKTMKIHTLCRKYKIFTITINRDYSVSCNYVNMSKLGLDELPIKFGIVDGTFDVSDNNLKTFKNFPTEVSLLDVEDNAFESVIGCPKARSIRFKNNKINSLEGLYFNARYIDLANNNISDLTEGIKIGPENNFFSVTDNNVTELFTLPSIGSDGTRNVYVTDNPIHQVLMNANKSLDYPDANWVDSFNSYNIIYNDGIGKTKIFKENLEYFYENELNRRVTRYFLESLKEKGYEVTTMSEYFKQKPETEI